MKQGGVDTRSRYLICAKDINALLIIIVENNPKKIVQSDVTNTNMHHHNFLMRFYQIDLGVVVQKACENATEAFKFLYPLDASIKDKIEAIARSYGASGVEYSEQVINSIHFICV